MNNNNNKLCVIKYSKLDIVLYKKLDFAIIVYVHEDCSKNEYNVEFTNKINDIDNEIEFYSMIDNEIEIEDNKVFKVFNLSKKSVEIEGVFKKDPIEFIGVKFGSELVGIFTLNITKGLLKFNPNLQDIQNGNLELQGIIRCIELTQNCLAVIIEQGFVNNHDLSKYPIMCDLIEHFTQNKEYIKGEFSHESFKWLYNLIQLSIYTLLVEYENLIILNNHLKNKQDLNFISEVLEKEADFSSPFLSLCFLFYSTSSSYSYFWT